jgi:phosphatidylserine/phosphatidylglycerophosphate/cardiolipin synthase-like enzyme
MKWLHLSVAFTLGFIALLVVAAILRPAQAARDRSMQAIGDHVILSEVFYDPNGSDNNLEWVELYNPTGSPIDLGEYSLGNGGTDYTYSTAQLTGVLPISGCWIIGGPTSNLTNSLPIFDQALDFNPDFQNGATPADGIALFNVKAISITPSTIPIDAVIYGTTNSNNLIDENGAINPPDVSAATSSKSNERTDITGTWRIQSTPTPNDCSVITTTVETPSLTPPGSVLINAVHFSALASGDEGFRLTNVSTQTITLTNWIATDGTSEGTIDLIGTLEPDRSIWLARNAITFTQQFGFKPDYEYEIDSDPTVTNLVIHTMPQLSTGDELGIREGASNWIDVVVWGSGDIVDIDPISPTNSWLGSNVAYTNSLGATGDILYRKLDEATSRIVTDTNTALDWANDRTDPITGRKLQYPGWDLEKFWQPAKVTATARLTVAIAPDNAFRVISNFLGTAQQSIKIEIYSFNNVGLFNVLSRTMRTRPLSVTVLMEGSPAGGLDDQELWVCQQLESIGGQCWFMIGDSAQKIYDRYDYQHGKMIIIDDRVVAIGSENFSPNSLPYDNFTDGTVGQRGAYFITDAPGVVTRALEIWNADFDPIHHRDIYRWNAPDPKYGNPPAQFVPITITGGSLYRVQFPNSIGFTAPLTFEMLSSPESSLRQSDSLLGLINQSGAGDTIDGEQLDEPPHWGPSASNAIDDPNIRLQALIDAASRGAHVRLLLDSYFDDPAAINSNLATVAYIDSLRALSPTLHTNLEARRGDPTFGGIHNKMFLFNIAGRKVSHVGSLNGTETSNKVNREIALQVDSATAFNYLRSMFEADWRFTRLYLPLVFNQYGPPPDHLLISKVYYFGSTSPVTGSEWVQIYNPTPITVSLSTYKLGDQALPGSTGFTFDGMWQFPSGASVAPGDLINVATTYQGFFDKFGLYPDYVFFGAGIQMIPYLSYTPNISFSLTNTGDEVLLLGPANQLIDGVAWGTGTLPGNVSCLAIDPNLYPLSKPSIARSPLWKDTDNCPNDFAVDPNAAP